MNENRTLYIVRHAKSSWDYDSVSDIDRPLKMKGIRDAYEVSRKLKLEGDIPDLIISSPAIRALHTANIFIRVFELKFKRFVIDERLYGSGIGVIKKVISEQDAKNTRLMIFGHNPDFSELSASLSGKDYIDLPTCGLCKIEFHASDWLSVSSTKVANVTYGYPEQDTLE
jgi:phosphohistidine phosphatase